MYYVASEANSTLNELQLLREEKACLARELEWSKGYMSRLEQRIVELHRVIDKLVEDTRMCDKCEEHKIESCDDCTFPDCQKCPEVPELAIVEVLRPYTL